MKEIRERFGSFQASDRRPRLYERLEAFLTEARAAGLVRALIVNGSFVTGQAAPNDIDLLLVLRLGHNFRADLGPTQYRIVDRPAFAGRTGLISLRRKKGPASIWLLCASFNGCACNPI